MFCFPDDITNLFLSDLACERYRADLNREGVSYDRMSCPCGVWERIEITSAQGAESIGRPIGYYDTLTLGSLNTLDRDAAQAAKKEVASELERLTEKMHISADRLLVVGLGNPALAPDSVGTHTAQNVKATMHIKELDEQFFSSIACSEIAVIAPGVKSSSGIDAAVQARGICQMIKPDAVIAIDSLTALAPERLGKTIQFSSTGVIPGSGVGNHRSALDESSLGTPVISIGIPTVISSDAFCHKINSENELSSNRKMLVAPQEIDEIARSAGNIISDGINLAFGIFC